MYKIHAIALFCAGDEGDSLYVLLEGEVTLGVSIDGRNTLRRLLSITPGLVFGEMALLDRQKRSAHALVTRASVLRSLTRAAFDLLAHEHPRLFALMLQNIAHQMSFRLRMTTDQLRLLED